MTKHPPCGQCMPHEYAHDDKLRDSYTKGYHDAQKPVDPIAEVLSIPADIVGGLLSIISPASKTQEAYNAGKEAYRNDKH